MGTSLIGLESNIDVVINGTVAQIRALRLNPDPILKACALALLPEVKKRVHVNGQDSSGNQIGTYSEGYMVVRTGNYKDAAKFKRGPKAGKYKDQKSQAKGDAGKYSGRTIRLDKNTGVFTGTFREGENRETFNRGDSTKVILSLTTQMENDFSVIATDDGYGLGYNNKHNYDKAIWCEETYGKKILTQLTDQELELVEQTANDFLPEYLIELSNNS